MSLPFAINGLGRVGRALLRIAEERDDLRLVAINDPAPAGTLAHLISHDSLHGRFAGSIKAQDGSLTINERAVPLFHSASPASIPWERTEARVVVESTGLFRSRELAAPHLERPGSSMRQVVISATAESVDATFCFGVNHWSWDPTTHQVVSNASCTTNCLAPVAKAILSRFQIEHALMSTVHCYTNSQRLVDMAHVDPRRARAAATNIVPTTSDAVTVIGEVLPELEGRIDGLAYRVPVPDGSLIDLVVRLDQKTDREELVELFRSTAQGDLAGILDVTDEELVSSDFIGSPLSATVDLPLLQQVGERMFRVVAWYDNEWGYANRLADLLAHIAKSTKSTKSTRTTVGSSFTAEVQVGESQ